MFPVNQAVADRIADRHLSRDEKHRYSRHLLLPEVGAAGQRKLLASKVLLIGAGGLGSPVSLYLAAAGVGTLGLVDFDVVDRTNLQRQILHRDADVGRLKIDSATERLTALNPDLKIIRHAQALNADNAMALIEPYDVVVDGTDNFQTRYLVNDCCVWLGKPNVYGSIYRFDGQASVFYPPHGPCYRCLFAAPPPPGQAPSCAEGGVLGVLPGQIGMIQATETLKLLLGVGQSLVGRLVMFDALAMRFDELRIERDRNCAVCGDHPTLTQPGDDTAFCGDEGAPTLASHQRISTQDLKALLDGGGGVQLVDVRSAGETEICRIEGAVHLPMLDLDRARERLNPEQHTVVYCKSGVRAARAVAQLSQQGFAHAQNLTGGILAWIREVDATLADY